MTRRIIKKRVGPSGVEINCETDASKWVDIKETKHTRYERAIGPRYQKTVYNHINPCERREYEDEPKITFKNPESESQQIEYTKNKGDNHGIIKNLWVESGRGKHYRKTRIHFANGEDNNARQVREQTVENEETGDHIVVERITRFSNEWGRGKSYQKKNVYPTNSEEQIEQMEGDCKAIS